MSRRPLPRRDARTSCVAAEQTNIAKDRQWECEVLHRIRNEFDLNIFCLTLLVEFFCLFCVCRATKEASEAEGEEEQEGRI